ncbi:MAG: YeeE/YedE thiosulfate transporter family protein, partial [Phycisphaerales bacterium]|nr:YeeE/YedE thiosulfate transporter family protein [Phycisphaerales bacterium]
MKWQSLLTTALIGCTPGLAFAQSSGAVPVPESGPAWSPYLVGALIGVLSLFTFYLSDKPLGASTAYARVAGMVGNLFSHKHTESLKYYKENKPKVDWEVMLVLGAVLGAFLAAWTGGEFTGEWLPPMWEARFGAGTYVLRMLVAFGGGVFMAFGARLAGGCTSGHGISGTMQ